MWNRVNKKVAIALCVLLIAILVSVGLTLAYGPWSQAQPPQTRVRRVSGAGSAIVVKKGGNLQAAINAAHGGDTIELEAGATFVGTITLPKKTGEGYVTIQSSRAGELPEGVRVGPDQAALMAKIVSPGKGNPALQTLEGAHHYRFIGIEILPKDASTFVYTLVWLGAGDNSQNTLEKVPHHLTIDRCYIHAWPDQALKRGIDLNSAHTEITNSYISGFKVVGQEAQAILGYNGPGPFKIINNYLEGAGENMMFGGGDPSIPNMVPSDIEIRRNHFFKPLAWRGVWQVKNLFELKNAQRVTIDGNIFENNWSDAQGGIAILFTTRNQGGTAPWSVVRDVTFTNNIVRHAVGAIQILGSDNIYPSAQGSNITISNNLFEDINTTWSNGGQTSVFLSLAGLPNLTVDHNTVLGLTTAIYIVPSQNPNLVFTNNIIKHQNGGIIGEGMGPPASYTTQANPFKITGNALVGAKLQYWDAETKYPPGNFYPNEYEDIKFVNYSGGDLRLSPNSPFKRRSSAGKDIGADILAIEAASATAKTGGRR
jgi:hypothetical protein